MSLNPAQKQAVEHFRGPALVLAGAGSGKTRVITQRIVRLLERGIPAAQIVALTFTNKAAKEMAERVHGLAAKQGMKKQAEALFVSTFHSFGLAVLSRESKRDGGAFTIFDQGDQTALVKELLASMRGAKNFDAAAVLGRISFAKNAFLDENTMTTREGDGYDELARLIFPKYREKLKAFRAYDFDDLVCEVAQLLQTRDDIRSRWQERARFLLVDEYQDTNRAQLALLKGLCGTDKNVCVVGDDDQSIYAWRGADVRNILEFEEEFPGATVIKLEQNYRSRAPVLAVANAVISMRRDGKHRKILFTDKEGGNPVRMAVAPSPDTEAKWVAKQIRTLIKEESVKPREIAVLYRSNGQAKVVEECLREHGIPYRMVGGQQFFERKEVKDLLAFLKLALNRTDEISLRRIINYPPRGIGETSVEKLATQARAKGWTLWQAIERVDAIDDISGPAREGCKRLESTMATLRKRILVESARPSVAARELCETIGLRAELDASSGSPNVSSKRWANVEGIIASFHKREMRSGGNLTSRELATFLQALLLSQDDAETEGDPGNVVTLSTLHGSKGLEFDHVYLLGCEEGLLPHSRTTDSRATDLPTPPGVDFIEEERRLFYVGVTRAKEQLTLCRCAHRVMRGKPAPRTASRFLADIPEEMLLPVEVKEQAATMVDMAQGAEDLLAALLGS